MRGRKRSPVRLLDGPGSNTVTSRLADLNLRYRRHLGTCEAKLELRRSQTNRRDKAEGEESTDNELTQSRHLIASFRLGAGVTGY